MGSVQLYQWLADAVLTAHVLLVVFVVGGLLAVLIGNRLGWGWVNHIAFRLGHLATIAVVVMESWFGITCPLTTLEAWLRERGMQASYGTSFIEHWLQKILFYQAPAWVFTVAYTAFGALVVASWIWYPPRRPASGPFRSRPRR